MPATDEFKITNPKAPFRVLENLVLSNYLTVDKKWSAKWLYENVSNLTDDIDLQNQLYDLLEILLYKNKGANNDN